MTAPAPRPATDRPVGDLHLQPPLRVGGGTTLRQAAAAMADARVSCLVVGTTHPWVVTEHDVAGAVAAGCPPDTAVDTVANHAPVWVTTTSSVAEAVEIMVHHGIRHVLVLEGDGRLRGILGLTEATEALLGGTG